jgi:prevent-host-death family protein
MDQVNVHEAKTQLSKLLARVEQGEEIVIARDGEPVAMLVPHRPTPKRREGGFAKGEIWFADDYHEYDEQIRRDFGIDE